LAARDDASAEIERLAAEVRLGGLVALLRCTATRPLCARFSERRGASLSEATKRDRGEERYRAGERWCDSTTATEPQVARQSGQLVAAASSLAAAETAAARAVGKAAAAQEEAAVAAADKAAVLEAAEIAASAAAAAAVLQEHEAAAAALQEQLAAAQQGGAAAAAAMTEAIFDPSGEVTFIASRVSH
jgi:hypothetical protein